MIKATKIGRLLPHLSAIVLCFLFALAGILINLNRFWQYESGYYDFGIFDKAIWNLANFRPPVIDHVLFGGKIIFADHFNPSIFILTPIYWLTDRSEALFIAQDIIVALSGYVLFRIGRFVLKNDFLAVAVLISYFLFTGLQNAIFSDFHELTVMTLFLMLTYWTILKGYKKLYFPFFILTLGFKESLFLLGIGLSFFIYFQRKDWKNIAISTFIISLLWGIVSIKIIIPFFSGGIYNYGPIINGSFFTLIAKLFLPIIKVKSVFLILLSFLFLPLFTPSTWIILILNFVHRFLVDGSTRWDLGLHYNAEIAPTLAVASILALKSILNKTSLQFVRGVAGGLIFLSFVLYRFILHGPLALAYHKEFYRHTKDFYFLDRMTAKIPKNSAVLAQNNLASRFLHQDVWILRENYRQFPAQYILFDLRAGQNPSNFLGARDIFKIFKQVRTDPGYKIYYHDGDQYIFKRR